MGANYDIKAYQEEFPQGNTEEKEIYPLDEDTASRIEEIVERTMSRIYDIFALEEDLAIEIGRIENEFVVNNMHGVWGFADGYGEITGEDEDDNDHKIVVGVNSMAENWQKCLESVTAHEDAHIWYWENRDMELYGGAEDGFPLNWESVLMEGHAMLSAEELVGFETPWREPEKVDFDEIEEERLIDYLHTDNHKQLFFGEGDEWTGWTGYALAYKVAQKMVEGHEDHMEGIKSLVDRPKEDIIETVREVV